MRSGRTIMKGIFLSLALVATVPTAALAADYAGSWEVAVREAGGKNYYLPMTDGRLLIEAGGQSASFNRLAFTGRLEKDGLHLACKTPAKPCGELVLQLTGEKLAGKGTLLDGDGLERPVSVAGQRPATRRAPKSFDYSPADFHNV